MLLWHGQVPFCHSLMLKTFLSLPNHTIRVCVKGKRINCRVGYGREIPDEYIFYGNEKTTDKEKFAREAIKQWEIVP